ncbi:MAG: triphosphoribosyl-dephospho-CoA synthase MdcB [Methylibium sp.]|nr:triphosphoribosyl-dephospho-CoA synthase MdcB [Methylibium sp.]
MLTITSAPKAVFGKAPTLPHAKQVRNAAVRALLQELITYPKPGLVSLVDAGSHADMDATSFVRSTLALRRYFEDAARAGSEGASFETLRQLGLAAEARMLRATRGVNTHRGAVFNLGLLAGAAGARRSACAGAPMPTLGECVKHTWGRAIAQHRRDATSHGSLVSARHAVGGAQAEAAAGFPSVYRIGLPAYRAVLSHGGSVNQARIQAFFELLARLDDTNLLHRGGPGGLAYARARAGVFVGEGGVFQPHWRERAVEVHRAFCARRLSPGGSADLLAACLFVHAIEP